MSGLPMRRVKEILLRLLPDEELESAKDIPSSRVTRQYIVYLKSKRKLLLALSPTNATRLLRPEHSLLTSESTLVSFLKENPLPQDTDPNLAPSRALSPFSPPPSSLTHLSPDSPPSSSSRLFSPPAPVPGPLPSPSLQPPAQVPPSLQPLSSFLPTIIHHEPSVKDLGYSYTIYELAAGTPLSTTECTEEERYAVNFQLGQLAYSMATIASPNGAFGPVLKVIGDSSRPLSPISSPILAKSPLSAGSSSDSSRRPSLKAPSPLPSGGGSSTWDIAFKTMAEAILRDGEDMSVLLPYDLIRRHISRLSYVLKTTSVPRLLLFDAGDEDNILVSRNPSSSPSSGELRLVGFRDWTTGVFGDPLLGSFWEAWDGTGPRKKGWGEGCKFIDKRTLMVRLMLYRCHRACVDIVREYYRPRSDSSEREMVARKRLTDVLRELEGVVVDEGLMSETGTPRREVTSPYSPPPHSPRTETATPKRTQDEAIPQKLSPRKKPKIEEEEQDPADADDEKEDQNEEESSEDEDEERYKPPPAASRPNPASLDYILNS